MIAHQRLAWPRPRLRAALKRGPLTERLRSQKVRVSQVRYYAQVQHQGEMK